jgi:hypothetical protein
MMYYPFVHPPRPVLWQALLYWDELTSIAPVDGYRFRHDLVVLEDLELYRPSHAGDLPERAHADLVSDLRQVVELLPGEDLVPVPGPLGPDNRVYWGKLPYGFESDLVGIGALVPDGGMLRASPVLLSRLMVVLAKHLAAATRGVIPFTDSPSANQVAFAPLGPEPPGPAGSGPDQPGPEPLGPDLRHRRCWQLQIGHLLPVPAPNVPLDKVLEFREAYKDERQELARAVRKLLLSMSEMDRSRGSEPGHEADPVAVQQHIEKAVKRLERAGRSRGILWMERSLWAFAGLGAAAAGAYAAPDYGWLFTALSGLGISVATVVTRAGASTDFAYLQHLRSTFPTALWPTATVPVEMVIGSERLERERS